MTILIIFLLAANLLVPLWAACWFCVSREGIAVDHVLLFSIGYFFYWVLPIGIGAAHLLADAPVMALWYSIYSKISEQTIALYLVISLCCYLAFWLGSWQGTRQCRGLPPRYRNIYFSIRLLDVPLAVGIVLAGIYAFVLRGQLFHGYTSFAETGWDTSRGSFTAVSVFLLSLAFLYSAKRQEKMTETPTPRNLLFNRYFIAYFIVAFLVLSLGGRLYFVSSLVMLLIYWTVYFRRISSRAALNVFLTLAIVAGLVGALRLNGPISTTALMLGLFQEPLFTGFSLTSYLSANTFEILRFPIFLLSDLLNLIPSALFPNKAELLLDPANYGFPLFNPLGATNSFYSFMINFGFLGTFAFLFLMGWLMSLLRGRDRNLLSRVIYVMLSGWIGFTFFRDAFSISLVKSMFQFSVLVPVLIVITLQLVSVFLRDLGRPVPAEQKG